MRTESIVCVVQILWFIKHSGLDSGPCCFRQHLLALCVVRFPLQSLHIVCSEQWCSEVVWCNTVEHCQKYLIHCMFNFKLIFGCYAFRNLLLSPFLWPPNSVIQSYMGVPIHVLRSCVLHNVFYMAFWLAVTTLKCELKRKISLTPQVLIIQHVEAKKNAAQDQPCGS